MIILNKYNLKSYETSTNLTETVQVWDSGTTYQLYDEVLYNDRIYISAKADNTDNPTKVLTSWKDDRPANYVAQYDNYPTTDAENNDDITLVYEHIPNIEIIALANMWGTELKIKVENSNGVILDKAILLEQTKDTSNWWEYYFLPLEKYQTKDWIEDVATIEHDLTVTITITKKDSIAKLGLIAIGVSRKLADCILTNFTIEQNPPLEIKRIDNKIVKFGGDNGWKKYSYQLFFKTPNIYNIKDLDEFSGKATLFIGDVVDKARLYSCLGVYTGYHFNPKDHTATLEVYSIDNY
jgi:hypothetical protein